MDRNAAQSSGVSSILSGNGSNGSLTRAPMQVVVNGSASVAWDSQRLARSLQSGRGLNEAEARAMSREIEADLRWFKFPVIPSELIEQLAKAKMLARTQVAQSAQTGGEPRHPDDGALKLTENALRVLKRRYLRKDAEGNLTETPEEMFRRVADNIAQGDLAYRPERVAETAEAFYGMIANLEFLPNSPTLMNAGGELQQLSACFVLPVEDSMDSIFEAIKDTAMIHKSGGGTGFAFSRLRPRDSKVRSTGGVSSGPVSFMKVFNAATDAVKQGGTRRGANMGILRVDHPDILEFITCKNDKREVTNFNISVGLTESFMEAVEHDEEYDLVEPHTGQVCKQLKARKVFNLIVLQAWQNGDPGIVFLDRINADNPTPQLGSMESTNPCGEQPLLPYESCNLGSINLAKMVVREGEAWRIDYDKLRRTVHTAVHFLDNVIEMNNYPLPQIEEITRQNRRIGLGVMGFADMLLRLGIPYNSDAGIEEAEQVMAFIHQASKDASRALAEERGAFVNFKGSLWDNRHEPPQRNSTVTTIAPTGTISIIAACSSGIEPLFAVSYFRNVMDNDKLIEVNPIFEEMAREGGFYSRELMEKISERGSVQGLPDVPEHIQRLFVTAHDTKPTWHLRMQAAFQKHTDNAVSKTVNFSHEATMDDVAEVYRLAYRLGCKGVTIYRDGSRNQQVLNVGKPNAGTPGEQKADPNPTDLHPTDPSPTDRGLGGANAAVKQQVSEMVTSKPEIEDGFARLRTRSRRLQGDTERIPTADGDLYITINRDSIGIAEVFLGLGKSGSLVNSLTEALGRVISIALRSGLDPKVLVKQLLGIQCGRQVWYEGELIQSVPDAIGKALAVHLDMNAKASRPAPAAKPVRKPVSYLKAAPSGGILNVCPDCSHLLEPLEGCYLCKSCGYSRCN